MKISLKKQVAKPPKGAVLVNLPLQSLSALRQMRATFSTDSIVELAESLKQSGQLNPGIAVALTHDQATGYLEAINKTWGTAFALHQFNQVYVEERAEKFYFFIVAGERRYRACQHSKIPNYPCQLHFGMSFEEAVALQAQENLHEAVPQEEAAALFALLWRTQKKNNPLLTLQEFAKKMGKSPDAIRRAVRFMALPISVQELVLPNTKYKTKGVSYGILCELARLQEAQIKASLAYKEEELIRLAYILVSKYKTIKEVAHYVTERITQLEQQEQEGLDGFELCLQEVAEGTKSRNVSGLETTIRFGEQHLERVAAFHRDPVIGRVASGSTVMAIERVMTTASVLAPQIVEGLKGARGSKKATSLLPKTTKLKGV